MANSATLTFGYGGTNFTRQYKFEGLTNEQCAALKGKVLALNASITSGTADGLEDFFISDDYNANTGVGRFAGIVAAKYEVTNITNIDLTEEA